MRIRLLSLILVLLSPDFAQSQKLAQLNSCKIDFVFGTPSYKGTKTIVFTDSGRIAKEIIDQVVDTTSNFGKPQENIKKRTKFHLLDIQIKDSVYRIDLDSMIGSKRRRIISFNQDPFIKNWTKIAEDTMLNRKCDIMEFHGFKIWYWKGIALKKEFPIPPNECNACMYEYAISIDENYIIKKDEFDVPEGIKME
jgi:hypothetical protein